MNRGHGLSEWLLLKAVTVTQSDAPTSVLHANAGRSMLQRSKS